MVKLVIPILRVVLFAIIIISGCVSSSGENIVVRVVSNSCYSGSIGVDNNQQSVDGCGTKEWTAKDARIVSAVFQKEEVIEGVKLIEGSSTPLRVYILDEKGNVLNFGETTAAYGVVSISYPKT